MKIKLKYSEIFYLTPKFPYNFNANFHKPSHFPTPDRFYEKNRFWITMVWKNRRLGLKFENLGKRIKLTIFSKERLEKEFLEDLIKEIRYRFNFDQDISGFCKKFENHKEIGEVIRRWKGMKPIAFNFLYENLMIFICLQNATVRRTVQMMENLFKKFGILLKFDGKELYSFWKPEDILDSSEKELRKLKLGYRSKFIYKISEQFENKEIDEFKLRKEDDMEKIRKKLLKIYGIGEISADFLLFEYFYFLDAFKILPKWEQKIISMRLFGKVVEGDKIFEYFEQFRPYRKLAFHYLWEDLFWRRKNERIEWLEREIRL